MEDEYDIILKNKLGTFFNYKTFFLPSTIILPCFFIIDVFRNYIYIFFSTFTTLMILSWNFPFFTKIMYSKPIYFDDLDNDSSTHKIVKRKILYNIENSNKFKTKFIIFQQFFSSIAISLLAEYINLRYKNSEYNTIELLGVLGGLISLSVKIIRLFGKLFLYYLYRIKKNEQEQLINEINNNSID
jgi:hypothetical protein